MSEHGNSLIKTPRQLITVVALGVHRAGDPDHSACDVCSSQHNRGRRGLRCDERKIHRRAHASVGDRGLRGLQCCEVAADRTKRCTRLRAAPAMRPALRARRVPATSLPGRRASNKDSTCWSSTPSKDSKRCLPKGGNSNLDPIEVARAVAFIGNQSGGKFKEPAAPASNCGARRCRSRLRRALLPVCRSPQSLSPPQLPRRPQVSAKVDGAAGLCIGLQRLSRGGCRRRAEARRQGCMGTAHGLGIDALTASVIKGKGAMPPRGAVANASDAELRGAVELYGGGVEVALHKPATAPADPLQYSIALRAFFAAAQRASIQQRVQLRALVRLDQQLRTRHASQPLQRHRHWIEQTHV